MPKLPVHSDTVPSPTFQEVGQPEQQTVALEKPEVDTPWHVLLFNDEIHTFEEVIHQLVKATGCTVGTAEDLAWKVHNDGKAVVFDGTFEECFRVQGVLKEIGLVTEIRG